jgi:hypothetical protein
LLANVLWREYLARKNAWSPGPGVRVRFGTSKNSIARDVSGVIWGRTLCLYGVMTETKVPVSRMIFEFGISCWSCSAVKDF